MAMADFSGSDDFSSNHGVYTTMTDEERAIIEYHRGYEAGILSASDNIKELHDEVEKLRVTFGHAHVRSAMGDRCDECGLDLRDPIHKRWE